MGSPMHNNIKDLIEAKTKEVAAEKNPPKDLVEETIRITGVKPDLSKMTDKQIQSWLDKGMDMLIDEVKRTKEPIKLEVPDLKTGEMKEILIKVDGKTKEVASGKELTKEDIKAFLKGVVSYLDKATREASKAIKTTGQTIKSDLNRITDVGAGSFGR